MKSKMKCLLFVSMIIFLFLNFSANIYANKLEVKGEALSKLRIFESKKDFISLKFENCFRADNGEILIKRNKTDKILKGSIISNVIKTDFPITELIPSFNIDFPTSTGASLYFQVSKDNKNWSEWLFIGRDGDTYGEISRKRKSEDAIVDTDYILLNSPYNYYKWRIDFYSEGKNSYPKLKLFAVSEGNSGIDKEESNKYRKFIFDKSKLPPKVKWNKKINVPYRSQLDLGELSEYVCCPTSISMVLEYYGVQITSREVCDAAFDRDYRLWGSWWRASQTFSKFGLKSYVVQLRDFDEIKEYISKDIPIIISIKTKGEQLPSSPYKQTPGHILVIVGLDENENVWVNDPYNTDGIRGTRKYTKNEITDVFINMGGVAIIAEKIR